jgi:predicted AAA+ superfamily ATPase
MVHNPSHSVRWVTLKLSFLEGLSPQYPSPFVRFTIGDEFRPTDLRRALTLGRDMTKVVDRTAISRRVWLLDEVTAVDGWTATLKSARDGTFFGNDTVVVTGTDAADIEGHLLAGRAGTVPGRRLRHLLPMSFRDFLAASRPELVRLEAVHPSDLPIHLRDAGCSLLELYWFEALGPALAQALGAWPMSSAPWP